MQKLFRGIWYLFKEILIVYPISIKDATILLFGSKAKNNILVLLSCGGLAIFLTSDKLPIFENQTLALTEEFSKAADQT